MLEDTRSPVGAKGVHPFSGKIFCADCGSPMVRRVSRSGGREYAYFICGGNKNDKNSCSSHCIKESLVYNMVFTSNRDPAQWQENFSENDSLLCALDRIFDDAIVFAIKGESFRGRRLETVSLRTTAAFPATRPKNDI